MGRETTGYWWWMGSGLRPIYQTVNTNQIPGYPRCQQQANERLLWPIYNMKFKIPLTPVTKQKIASEKMWGNGEQSKLQVNLCQHFSFACISFNFRSCFRHFMANIGGGGEIMKGNALHKGRT